MSSDLSFLNKKRWFFPLLYSLSVSRDQSSLLSRYKPKYLYFVTISMPTLKTLTAGGLNLQKSTIMSFVLETLDIRLFLWLQLLKVFESFPVHSWYTPQWKCHPSISEWGRSQICIWSLLYIYNVKSNGARTVPCGVPVCEMICGDSRPKSKRKENS